MTIQDGRRIRTLQDTMWIFGFSLVGILLGLAVLFFAAACLTALVTGNHVPSWGETVDAVVARPVHPAAGFTISPGPVWLVYTLWGLTSATLGFGAVKAFFALASRSYDRRTGKTRVRDIQTVAKGQAVATAEKVLERSLGSQNVPDKSLLVMPLGTYRTTPVYAQHEDSICIIAPARSGKTMFLGVPWILDAPGAVVVTGTKNDVVLLTAMARRRVGKVYSFDLNNIANWPDNAPWDPVDGCDDPEEALERGRAWAAGNSEGGGGGNTAWFNARAGQILAYFLHAAAIKPGGSLRDVVSWAGNFANDEPIKLLRSAPSVRDARWGDGLAGMTQSQAGETTSSLQITLQGLLAPLSSPRILDQLCPAPNVVRFRTSDFVSGHNTLYLLTGKGATSTAPLVTMFLDSIVRAAQNYSQHQPGQRLWPTLRLVLDEAANVAPIPALPEIMSDSGGRGIQVIVICQSFAQMDNRWGREEAEAIRANATVTVYLPGIKEQDRLRDLSEATGQYRASRTSYSSNSGYSTSTEKENVMQPDDIRRMPVGKGLVFYRGLKHMVVNLTPWWERPDADQIKTDLVEAEDLTRRRMPAESTQADVIHPADRPEELAA